jgi:lysophospholipid acyltransferase (LPLAT)-like uncharacterized protein
MLDKILTSVCVLYVRLFGWSTIFRTIGEKNLPEKPYIYALWHRRLMFLVHSERGRAINVMVSASKDGELTSNVIHKFGFRTTRGSSSRMGSRSAIAMIRVLKKTKQICAITPDGPKGPRRQAKEGLAIIAQKSGCPIVPLACAVKRNKILNTWDKFILPLPFNKGVVINGRPIYVNSSENIQEAIRKITEALNNLSKKADKIVAAM